MLFASGYYGLLYIATFSVTNITFVVSIQNTNVANTLVMIAMAPMLSAVLGGIFLKEMPDRKTWIAIFVTFMAAIYIFYDSIQLGNIFGDILGLITTPVNDVAVNNVQDTINTITPTTSNLANIAT